MATEKTLKARLKMKHGKASEWALATKFTPLEGEIIVYDVDETYTSPRFKVGDGTTNVNNLKFVNQDELAKITTLGDDLLAVKNGYLPLSGGTVTGTVTVQPELYSNAAIISKRNSCPQFILQNANGAQLGTIYSTSSDGSYSNINIAVNSSSSDVAYFDFAKNGQFTAPNNIYSKGTLVSQTNSYPGLMLQNTSGANLAMLYSNGTTGGYSNAVLRVYSSAGEYSSFSFGKDGSLSFGGNLYSGSQNIKGDSYPVLSFTNTANDKVLAYLQPQTSTGDYADVVLAVKNSSGQSNFWFAMNGIFSAPSDIISNGGILKSSKNSNPSFVMTNQNGTYLASMRVDTTDGSYGHALLTVYKSATESNTFTFGNTGNFRASGIVYGSRVIAQANEYPQMGLYNASGAPLSLWFVNTTSGGYSNATLRVNSSASAYKEFVFKNNGAFVSPSLSTVNEYAELGENPSEEYGYVSLGNANYGNWTNISCADDGFIAIDNALRATAFQVDSANDWPSLWFKCSSKTNSGVLLQASSNHGFGIYCYGSDLDSASTRYYEGYTFPSPATGLTANKNYTVYSEKNIIYSSSQPTGVKGAIWLKPV